MHKCTITVSPYFYIGIAAALLLFPIKWVFAWLLAATFHELCHCTMLRWFSCPITNMEIRLSGATIYTPQLSAKQELISALAGPLGGLSLLLLASRFPRLAVCGLFQSVFNLIPIYPLDGGRALRSFCKTIPGIPEKRCAVIEKGFLILLVMAGALGCIFLKYGLMPLILTGMIALRRRNSPCKD